MPQMTIVDDEGHIWRPFKKIIQLLASNKENSGSQIRIPWGIFFSHFSSFQQFQFGIFLWSHNFHWIFHNFYHFFDVNCEYNLILNIFLFLYIQICAWINIHILPVTTGTIHICLLQWKVCWDPIKHGKDISLVCHC